MRTQPCPPKFKFTLFGIEHRDWLNMWSYQAVGYAYADDGFGNMVATPVMAWLWNTNQIMIEEH